MQTAQWNGMGRIQLFQNGCSQSSRFPTAGQGERRLWERDCFHPKASPFISHAQKGSRMYFFGFPLHAHVRNRTFSRYLVPLFQNESLCDSFHVKMSLTAWKWICRRNTFSYEWFRMALSNHGTTVSVPTARSSCKYPGSPSKFAG